jgi:undecaprenyl-diphosphatase
MDSAIASRVPGIRRLPEAPSGVPVLEAAPRGPVARFEALLGRRHPVAVFVACAVVGLLLLTAGSIACAYLLTDVVGHAPVVGAANRHFGPWLARHRTANRTEASLIGSIIAGGVVLPIVAGVFAAVCTLLRHWRLAAFAVFALLVESAAYRGTTLVFHEHRPRVHRLENLPVDASYPSGHTAASIAVYGGLVLLLTSRIKTPAVRIASWTIAVAVPVFVGMSRMYRGMHHPLDVVGGALLGIAALVVVVCSCRAAGEAERRRRLVR